jgi:hypothetical protein
MNVELPHELANSLRATLAEISDITTLHVARGGAVDPVFRAKVGIAMVS